MADFDKGRVFSGARARLLVNGIKVGYARNCSGGESLQLEPVEAMDNVETEEFVPTRYRCRFSMGYVRIVGKTAKTDGYVPSLGGNSDEHLSNILTNGDLVVTIEDNQTGLVIMTLEQARVQDHNWSIDATGIVGQDLEFVAIRMRDESEV